MYLKPRVERFGTFRELTQVGNNLVSDGCTITGPGGSTTGNNFPPLPELCGRSG